MDELLADFIAETREMLEASSGEIVAWETDPADRARLDSIFRFVHTVKGNCGFFDFPRLEKLSHAAEDALAECRAGRREPDQELVSAVLAIIDRIGELTDMIEAGEELGERGDEALVAALENQGEADAAPVPATVETNGETAEEEEGEDNPKTVRNPSVQRSIRLPVSLLDEVMKGVSDMVLARNDLARRLRDSGTPPEIEGPFDRLSGILTDVRDSITRMRMQRLEHLFGSFPRLVRDLSKELGKQVMVDFEGGDVELDREMVEIIRDPLTHIIRNAIDHGIEAPSERLKGGKREIGLLRFAARQAGNQISLVISDDGRGIAGDTLAAKSVDAGLYTEAETEAMSERRKLHLVFEPGLSTADKVSSVSGRGVGMDVVRANIEKVGGSIELMSTPGEGTSFHLKLPLTLSIIAALTVGSGGQRYAIPRSYVEEVAFGNGAGVEFAAAGDRRLVTFRNQRVPCISLGDILGEEDNGAVEWEAKTLVLVRLATDDVFALAVDQVFDHEDVVVKPIAPAVMQTRLYAGTTLLDDGRPMMLLDMPNIAISRALMSEGRKARPIAEDEASAGKDESTPAMLFAGLDGRRRAVRLELVRRIDTIDRSAIDIEGERAQAVIEGKLITLAGHEFGPLPDEGRCRLLRLSDGESEIAYAVAEVLDATGISSALTATPGDAAIEGIVLVDGQPVPVIDGHRLFAHLGSDIPHGNGLVCRMPQDSEWARTILEPLVVNAGYRIATGGEDDADVAIVLAEDAVDDWANAPSVIRLRVEREDDGSGSIYRYDRDGLLAALKQARSGEAK
jgi:two-component system, chemotaxis family, sensor kinase CheA